MLLKRGNIVKIIWEHRMGSILVHNCDKFEMECLKNKAPSPCPIYLLCRTPCDAKTAKPTDKKAKPIRSITIRFGRRSCRHFVLFQENWPRFVRWYDETVFCPLSRHCKNSSAPHCFMTDSNTDICKNDTEDCVFGGTGAFEGHYCGKDTTRSNYVPPSG